MREYTIERADGPVPLTGQVNGTIWADARVLEIDTYPWYESGERQSTAARLLYDDHALYMQFHCRDRHISAAVTELNGPVCTDSCVELFAAIDPGVPDGMCVDVDGRLYSTAGDGVHVFTPDGVLLGKIHTPKTAANCTFGGPGRRTMFITASDSVWSVGLNVLGAD